MSIEKAKESVEKVKKEISDCQEFLKNCHDGNKQDEVQDLLEDLDYKLIQSIKALRRAYGETFSSI